MSSTTTNATSPSSSTRKPTDRKVISRNSNLSSSTNQAHGVDSDPKPVKRIPPIKAPVGLAPSPDLKSCKSKVGSLHNIKHRPTGGEVTIPTQKLQWNVKSKVGSLENKEHKPAGGKLKIETRKLEWKASPRVQSLVNMDHKPGGGNVKIFNESYREKSASPVVRKPNDTNQYNINNNDGVAMKPSSSNANKSGDSLYKDLKGLNI